ncbi:beta-ketoacyl synthase N-terminal-like domain-containing protein [Streptomyces sp. NPDC006654]|uniref:beta-ketoacyl synthase N-terminal-like domain-containing protein n=1 Tax=Streptomyces sp. NPDC006654 TaxID=3156897 RepID=UPI0033DA27D7
MTPTGCFERRRRPDTVVTSASVLHPAATTVGELDRILRCGEPTLRRNALRGGDLAVPAALLGDFDIRAWARTHCDPQQAAVLRRVAGRATVPVQTACCVAIAACTAAKLTPDEARDTAVVIAGNNLALSYQAAASAAGPGAVRAGHLLNCFDTDALGAVGEVTGCTGEGWPIGGSSAAGTLALMHAARLVAGGIVPRCLVVAPVNDLSALEFSAFVKAGAMARLAPGQDAASACRPFDQTHDGFAAAHVAAAVLVESAAGARRRGVEPLGRVLGHAVGTDGRRTTQPDPAGQAGTMRVAIADSGLTPSDIDYVNTHGTGAPLGDDCEAAALAEVFAGTGTPWINSTKALLGHGLGASGLLEAIATLLQLAGDYCHRHPFATAPVRPDLRFADDTAAHTRLRTAVSNSFAFSGINASLVLGRATTEEDGS